MPTLAGLRDRVWGDRWVKLAGLRDHAWETEWAKFVGRRVSVVMACDAAGRDAASRIVADLTDRTDDR